MVSKETRKPTADGRTVGLRKVTATDNRLRKKKTGINGFDQITGGGLPDGRLTAIVGGAGTGKSLLALQFLVHRAKVEHETGLYVTFEEPVDRIKQNVAGFDWGFEDISLRQLSLIDARLPSDVVQSGSFDLSALLAGLSARKAENGAVNVVFDGIDLLLNALNNENLERKELMRLDDWIRSEGVSAVLTVKSYSTSERDQNRADLVQYITDCVVLLQANLFETKLSRILRVVKYRGSGFSANSVPMIIGASGIAVVPAQALREGHPVYSQRLSSGIVRLDAVLDGGFIRGSSILITGAPGTAKTSLAASLVRAECLAGRRALFVSFDESDTQILSNLRSIGIDLSPFADSGELLMASLRSAGSSPEECFLKIAGLTQNHRPDILVVDPMSAFADTAYPFTHEITENLIDLAKSRGITFLGTSLLGGVSGDVEMSATHVSTIADTWLHLSYIAQKGERNRALTIVKSRGTAHSNQVRELSLSRKGLDLIDVFVGEGEVLLGSARLAKEQEISCAEELRKVEHQRQIFAFNRDIADLKTRVSAVTEELQSKVMEAELAESAERVRVESSQRAANQRGFARRHSDDATGAIDAKAGSQK